MLSQFLRDRRERSCHLTIVCGEVLSVNVLGGVNT